MTVIANLLPTGTVSEVHQNLRAVSKKYQQYPHKRGVYSGGVGYINCNHNLDFALAIRTMMIDEQYMTKKLVVALYMILFLKRTSQRN